jgi:K+-transporting ATPase KdpF subunit
MTVMQLAGALAAVALLAYLLFALVKPEKLL